MSSRPQGLQGPLHHLVLVPGHQGQVDLAAMFLAAQREAEVDQEQPSHAGFAPQPFGGALEGVAVLQVELPGRLDSLRSSVSPVVSGPASSGGASISHLSIPRGNCETLFPGCFLIYFGVGDAGS